MIETTPHLYRSSALSHRKPTRFRLAPSVDERAAMAATLGLQAIYSLGFEGEISPVGRSDFVLTAQLRADVVQDCVVTLAPVPAKIDEPVSRRYVADYVAPEGDEVELLEDDTGEALPEVLDLTDVLREALALALPLYPRAPGAALGEAVFAAPETQPLTDADLRPFAGLAALVRKDPEPEA
ncbi:MAG: DUF177 domain-containing protein [Paracoccaceae bacterium]